MNDRSGSRKKQVDDSISDKSTFASEEEREEEVRHDSCSVPNKFNFTSDKSMWVLDDAGTSVCIRGCEANEILKDFLWLGRGSFACDEKKLKRAGITHILTVANDTPDVVRAVRGHSETFRHEILKVGDFGTDEGIARVFKDALSFIEIVRQTKNAKLYVHCANGSNRSPTIVVAYLVSSLKMSLKDAYATVMSRRPHIMILKDNREELRKFEKEIRGKNSTDPASTFLKFNRKYKNSFKRFLKRRAEKKA